MGGFKPAQKYLFKRSFPINNNKIFSCCVRFCQWVLVHDSSPRVSVPSERSLCKNSMMKLRTPLVRNRRYARLKPANWCNVKLLESELFGNGLSHDARLWGVLLASQCVLQRKISSWIIGYNGTTLLAGYSDFRTLRHTDSPWLQYSYVTTSSSERYFLTCVELNSYFNDQIVDHNINTLLVLIDYLLLFEPDYNQTISTRYNLKWGCPFRTVVVNS